MKAKDFFLECENRALHGSITRQSITSYSIEIYTGYVKNYKKIFYTDGHISMKKALKEAKKYFKNN